MFKKIFNTLIIILLLLAFFHAPILEGLANFLIVQDKLEKTDAIMVLAGDNNGERVAQAVKLYNQGYGKYLLMSGGPVMWHETYADNMKRQAVFLGVNPKNILVQDRSLSTYEDAKYSFPILKAHGIKSIILVSSPFHMRRALRTVKRAFKNEIKVIGYPVQKDKNIANGWWTRHEGTQAIIWEYEALVFYTIKGI
jgi:uncharacterized SAM-binding protein YcdF (DUF218 family)